MRRGVKFSVGIWAFGPTVERFCPSGYREDIPLENRLEQASKIEGLGGIEYHYPQELSEKNVDKIKELSKSYELKIVMLGPNLFSEPKWAKGALSASNEKTRKEAIQRVKASIDLSKELGAAVCIWPGQDGYDYPFQVDYRAMWNRFTKSVKECAEHRPDVKIALEYKMGEPKTHILLATVGKTLSLIQEIGLNNLGVNVDFGHAFMAYENLAESIVIISRYNRLYHTHFNDSFAHFDDDMIVGTVHFWETLELLYWLQEVEYDGWYGLDLFPYREEPVKAVQQSVRNIEFMMDLIEKVNRKELRDRLEEGEATNMQLILRKMLGEKRTETK